MTQEIEEAITFLSDFLKESQSPDWDKVSKNYTLENLWAALIMVSIDQEYRIKRLEAYHSTGFPDDKEKWLSIG
jgi:hypothetical protein